MSVCKICGEEQGELHEITEQYLIQRIKVRKPEWVQEDGACPKCIDYLKTFDREAEQMDDDADVDPRVSED